MIYDEDWIVRRYRGCKYPQDMIGILAQLTGRTADEIRALLILRGEDVPERETPRKMPVHMISDKQWREGIEMHLHGYSCAEVSAMTGIPEWVFAAGWREKAATWGIEAPKAVQPGRLRYRRR